MRNIQNGGTGRSAAAIAALTLIAGTAMAGGSSEQSVLVIDPTDPDSMAVGHHYAFKRNIPASNIVYMRPGATNFAAFGDVLESLKGELAVRGVEGTIDYIILAPSSQFFVPASGLVSDTCFPVGRFATTSCYTMAFLRSEVLGGTLNSQHLNRYYNGAYVATAFDSQTQYVNGVSSTNSTARRYYVSGMLGYTGSQGNTVEQLVEMIDRSVSADGSRPAADFVFMSTTDTARNVRQPQFAAVVTTINFSLGGTASQLSGVLPPAMNNLMGVMTGIANFDWASSGSTMIPGSFGDHLTSYGATFDIFDQTKVSAWINAGASGSAGAVEEPCNYTGKFPHPKLHAFYKQGMCLGEAYLRSVQFVPFQGMFYGDPLTRAYAWPPNLAVTNAPAGPVTGVFALTPNGSATLSGAQIGSHELFIDGVSKGTVLQGGSFSVNTNQFDDGWHELRVLTTDTSNPRHTRSWTGAMTVVNDEILAAMTPPASSTPSLNDLVTVGLTAAGPGVQEVRLLANGRVVATRTSDGPVSVFGRNLGPGRVKLQCEALFLGNYVSRSEPVEIIVSGEGSPPSPTAPVAHNYRKKVLRTRGAAVELPAAFADGLSGAVFELVTPAANAAVNIVGSTAMVIPGPSVAGNDSFQFRVVTPSGTSNSATVTLWYSCASDFDGNGAASVPDIFAFLSAWFAANPVADFDDSGGAPNVPDIFAFLSAWFAGCN